MAFGEIEPFALQRIGVLMEGEPFNLAESEGVLNPGCCRGRDHELYLFPRLVAKGNYSRIGLARVLFENADPIGVQRLGYALEPSALFERNERTAGVEDPRVTFVAAINLYLMTYVAYGPHGPRVALAISEDAQTWQRIGPAQFAYQPEYDTDFNLYDNKDALIFPEPVRAPDGRLALAMMHRPDYTVSTWTGKGLHVPPVGVEEARPAIWLSYVTLSAVQQDVRNLQLWDQHQLLAVPEQPWESLKIGGGTPPVRTPFGWLTIFHGVDGEIIQGVDQQPQVRYCAGVLILDIDDPRKVVYRSTQPILAPDTVEEQHGIVSNVVFPTGIDVRDEQRIDVYYGMADARIGVARMQLPAALPNISAV